LAPREFEFAAVEFVVTAVELNADAVPFCAANAVPRRYSSYYLSFRIWHRMQGKRYVQLLLSQ
jgi:hypothetical protein